MQLSGCRTDSVADVPVFKAPDYTDANGVHWVFSDPTFAGVVASTANVSIFSPKTYEPNPGTFESRPALTRSAKSQLLDQINNHATAHRGEVVSQLVVTAAAPQDNGWLWLLVALGGAYALSKRRRRRRR